MFNFIKKNITLLIIMMIAVWVNADNRNEKDVLLTGYVIEVNEDQTLIIDLGKKQGIKMDDEFVIYEHDKVVVHPLTNEEIRVPGMEVARASVKDIYDTFSILAVDPTSFKKKITFEKGFSVKYINDSNDSLKTRLRKRKRKAQLKKSVTTIESSFSTGTMGKSTVLYENFFLGYKFPTRLDYFRFELQIAQFLSILDIYSMDEELKPQVHVYANTVFHFEIWQHKENNGGLGLAVGGGFSQTGFAGNLGFIIGNMNKTGLSAILYGIWNSSLIVDMHLNIQLYQMKKFGLSFTSQMMYTYYFSSQSNFVHGINFNFGPSFKVSDTVHINVFGGITNTVSEEFGGVGGIGIKLVL